MHQIRAEQAEERRQLTDAILADLGRSPSALDRVNAANIASRHVKATWQEAMGEEPTETRQQLNQALRAAGLKLDKPAPAKPRSIAERLRDRGYTAASSEKIPQ